MMSNGSVETIPLLLRIILSNEDDENNNATTNGEYNPLKSNISGTPNSLRHLSLTTAVQCLSTFEILHEIQILDEFRRTCTNLYQRVRALFFLYAIHRFHLPKRRSLIEKKNRRKSGGVTECENGANANCRFEENGEEKSRANATTATVVCPKGYAALLDRWFEEAIDYFLASVPLSPSTIPISDDNVHNDIVENGDGDDSNKDSYAIPGRTSLISNMTFSRMDSAATEVSDNSDFYKYSTGSSFLSTTVLDGDRISSSSNIMTNLNLLSDSIERPRSTLLPSDATSSALAKAYRSLAFQTLADQVKSSVRSHPGNEWMFQLKDVTEQPLKFVEELLGKNNRITERTPVRMDLSHSCWSDIFFLGMDYPEAARVINCSVDLAVLRNNGGDAVVPTPPIECRLRLTTDDPGTIRLTSVDLKCSVLLTHVSQVFNYGADYLGLLKAGLVASGIVPLGLEKLCEAEDIPIRELISKMMPTMASGNHDECRYGLELTTNVHNIPKGSRLAVSTNLLGSIIAVSMRATNQTKSITGPLLEPERRLVAARAILGEWLGGSGGGWQDSGGVWPGLKLIYGVKSREGDPEWGISRGRLLPQHRLLKDDEAPKELLHVLEKSLVLVHGGMAQNVG